MTLSQHRPHLHTHTHSHTYKHTHIHTRQRPGNASCWGPGQQSSGSRDADHGGRTGLLCVWLVLPLERKTQTYITRGMVANPPVSLSVPSPLFCDCELSLLIIFLWTITVCVFAETRLFPQDQLQPQRYILSYSPRLSKPHKASNGTPAR